MECIFIYKGTVCGHISCNFCNQRVKYFLNHISIVYLVSLAIADQGTRFATQPVTYFLARIVNCELNPAFNQQER